MKKKMPLFQIVISFALGISIISIFSLHLDIQQKIMDAFMFLAYWYCWSEIKWKKVFCAPPRPSTSPIVFTPVLMNMGGKYIFISVSNKIRIYLSEEYEPSYYTLPILEARPFLQISLEDELTKQTCDITTLMMPYYVIGNQIDHDFLEFITNKKWPISTLVKFLDANVTEHEHFITNTIQFTSDGNYIIHKKPKKENLWTPVVSHDG